MFKICPECENDKVKARILEKREYDPNTGRTIVHEDVPVVEYHCSHCGWIILVEDDETVTRASSP